MMISPQELFNSQAEFTPQLVGILNEMIDLQKRYHHETGNTTFSEPYYKELKEIADNHELEYTEPKFRSGLKGMNGGVGSTPVTLH